MSKDKALTLESLRVMDAIDRQEVLRRRRKNWGVYRPP